VTTPYNRDGGAAGTKLELLLGGTWTDITGRSSKDGQVEAQVTSGSSDAAQAPSPVSFSGGFVNDDGALTPYYPLSPWYGQVTQNTRARLSAAGTARLWVRDTASAGASCPDSAGLHAAGDIDVRADCAITDYSAAIIIGKNPSWQLQLDGNGLLGFAWNDGTHTYLAQCAVQPQPGRRCLRAVLALSTGIVTFYTAAPGAIDSGPWTQLGDPADSGSGATSVTTTGSFLLGGGAPGSYWEGRLLIAGTAVASPSPSAAAPGAATFTDGHSNTFTVGTHAEISDRDWRVHGEIASNQRTDPSPLATLQVAGPLRRLQQGRDQPVRSALRRAIESQAGTLTSPAYWPWEDPAGSANIASATGGPPMISDPSRLPQFAADGSFDCSAPLPQLGTTAMRGSVPAYTSSGSLIVRFLYRAGSALGTPPSGGWPLVRASVVGGTAFNLDFRVFTGYGLGIQGGNNSGDVFSSGVFGFGVTAGTQLYVSLELRPSGGNVNWARGTVAPGASSGSTVTGSYAGSIGKATSVLVHAGSMSDTVIGHVSVQSDWTSMFSLGQPLAAWAGEAAGKRYQRLCGENGYDCRILGAPAVTAPMGPQSAAELDTLLTEAQAVDGGLQFEPRDSFSLGYRTLASMLNQAPALTEDYASAEIPRSPAAADDDQRPLVNDWTVSDASGASARVTLDDGSPKSIGVAGRYAGTATANTASPYQLPDVAGMLLARSAAAGPRFPSVGADLGQLDAGAAAAAVALLPGDVVELASMPPSVSPQPTVRQVTTGATETCGPGRSIEWNAADAAAYDVMVADDPVLGRAESDGVTLRAAITSAATTAVVDVAGTAITTSPADYPVDVNIAGEQVTVTAAAAGDSRIGMYMSEANFQQPDYNGVAALWSAWSGQASKVTRYYAGVNYSYTTDLAQMVAAGVRICISFTPAYSPPSSSDLASITGLLATLAAAGADVLATIWHEPALSGLTAAQYVAAVQYYSPGMRAYCPFWLCLTGNDSIAANGYDPGAAYYDGVAADQYEFDTFDPDDNSLTNAAAIADAAGVPLGLWEFNGSTGPSYFTGDNHTFAAGIGNWAAGNNSTVAHSAAVNPFGVSTGALQVTATASGNCDCRSAAAANWATQMQACSPGDEITVGTWSRAVTTSRHAQAGATFYTSSGTLISTVYDTTTNAANSASAWTSHFGKVTAPASAAFYVLNVQVLSPAAGESHLLGMAYGADSTSTGGTQAQVTAFFGWLRLYLGGRVNCGLQNGDLIIFSSGMPGNGSATAIQHSSDYRIGLWQALRAQLAGTSGPQALTLTRAVNGIAKAHAAGEPVTLWTPPAAAPI
jgi:hypothetical protein